MSLLPLLLSELLEESRRSPLDDIYDQNFGLGLLNNEILRPRSVLMNVPLRSGYLRPWRSMAAGDSGVSNIESDKTEFKINLDVQQFKPDELKVKVVDDFIVVEAKHDERSDQHGFVSRQFTRRYKIPENVDIDCLTSNLSSDGVLTLKAPKTNPPEKPFREIPITQTKEPAIKVKDTGAVKKEEQTEQ